MKIFRTNPYLSLVNEFLIDSPVPININYLYNLGSLLGLNLVVLIITGISLAMHYNPSVDLAFSSSEHIVRDVNNGYLLRYIHANAVSMFFIMVYAHIGKGLYYGSYRAPRRALWIVGVLIFIVKMAKLLAKMYYLKFHYDIKDFSNLRNVP
jgi:ubiquinol-cytochrome c reductase cytochrome b subunit